MRKPWLVWLFVGGAAALAFIALEAAPMLQQRRYALALKDSSPAVRAAAIRALDVDGNEQLFIEALGDQDPDVRLLAADRLGERGARGAERASALVRALNDDHAGVRREAAWSLGHIGPDAWPALREGLADERPRVRTGAALALGDAYYWKDLDPWPSREATTIAPILRRLLDDPDPDVRGSARRALGDVTRWRTADRGP
jgi:HEAT repeat protein